mgnify:CR=1 FL=1
MPRPDRILMGPGPGNPYPEAIEAFMRPMLGHLDPAFLEIMDDTCEDLRTVWGTRNSRTLPISATGSAGMEAAFVNTVHPGDVVVVAQKIVSKAEGRLVPVDVPRTGTTGAGFMRSSQTPTACVL